MPMPINADKPHLWKADTRASVDQFNRWFMRFAPKADAKGIKMPVDAVIQPKNAELPHFPLLIEAKSAGDFTNVNKRRKEEAIKITQLKATYGQQVVFVLFLCGYFDAAYLGYEAAEGIDWIWEHRIEDIDQLGI